MRTRVKRGRSTRVLGMGRERAAFIARRLGISLKEGRVAAGLSQRELGEQVGLSQPEISRLEAGRGSNAGVDTWASLAAAVGGRLAAFFEHAPGADRPRDLEHLRRQSLVVRTATPGEWTALPEANLGDAGPWSLSIDVLLGRAGRREAAVVEIWDLLLDGGQAMRGLDTKVAALREQLSDGWRVKGLLVIRGTLRNRRLVHELAPLFGAKYTASSQGWLRALGSPGTPMPDAPGLLWTDVKGTRLIAARLRA